VHTLHPTVLVGSADWDAAALPREEFSARIAALWRACGEGVAGALVYGSPRHHAELAYLTNLTPKLEPALALIPAAGAPRLLVGGGVNMVPAAKPLTWIPDVAALRGAGKAVVEWTRTLPAGRLALIGADAIRFSLHREIVDALGSSVATFDATAQLRLSMRRKSARELTLIRQACAMLDHAVAALRSAKAAGKSATDVILAAEQAAFARGAQDVRTLFSRDGRTLRPFEVPVTTLDLAQAYIAVRHRGYWAEGFVMPAEWPDALSDKVHAALRGALPLLRAGARLGDVDDAVARALHPAPVHPVVTRAAVPVGLSLDDDGGRDDALLAGDVISLRAGVAGPDGTAIGSAMVVVGDGGHEVLWTSLPA
jgi:Xaa-Pro aminopeptidase